MAINDRVEALLEDIRLVDPDQHALVSRLRAVILAVGPEVTEEVKYGGLLFSAGRPFCGVFAYRQHVSLEFSEGAGLADPGQVLEGTGKYRRHIKLRSVDDITGKQVGRYIEAAHESVGLKFSAVQPAPGP